jgi:hypothetical protein
MAINRLKRILGIGLAAVLSTLPLRSNAQQARFDVYNYSPNVGDVNYVTFFQNASTNLQYNPLFAPSLETWTYDSSSNKLGLVSINPLVSKTYSCPLKCNGTIPNNATNYVSFQSISNFPANVLITSLIVGQGTNRVGDVRKGWAESKTGKVYNQRMNNITNSNGGVEYATNFVNIAPIETTATNFFLTGSGTNTKAVIQGKARPGTVLWPEWSTNLANAASGWTSMSNQAKYISVNSTNFGGYDGFSWTNLPATNGNTMFFRVGCDSYNSGTSNLLAQSEAKFGLAAPKVSTLEATVQKSNNDEADRSRKGGKGFRVLR